MLLPTHPRTVILLLGLTTTELLPPPPLVCLLIMATPDLLVFYRAIYDGDLLAVKEAVGSGINPKTTSFGIQTDEMCLCSLAFENLGLEFVEEYTPFDGNYGHSSDPHTEATADVSGNRRSEGHPATRIYQPPLLEWLETGQCGHVAIRAGNDTTDKDEDDEDFESEDDLASDLDLEIYGVRISPHSHKAAADDELEFEETRALLEHSRRIKQYEVPTPPDPLPAAQPPTPRHEQCHIVRDVTDSMNNLLISDTSESFLDLTTATSTENKTRESTSEDNKENISNQPRDNEEPVSDLRDDDDVFNDVMQAQAVADDNCVAPQSTLNPCKFPYYRELESLGSEDGVGSDFFLTEMKQASVNPLHIAAARGHGEVIEYLVTSLSCDVNEGTLGSEDTPLHIAARWGHTDIVRLLLRLNANPHRLNGMGYSALHLAIESNDQECIKVMLDSLNDLPSLDVQTKQILLVHALAQDQVPLAASLIEKLSLDINEPLFDSGSSILHKTAAVGSPRCLQHLLENGADANSKNQEGETALHVAAANGHVQCVCNLLAAGARPVPASNWMIGDDQTPTMLAAYNNYPDVVDVLLPHDDINCCSEYGDTALHFAAYRGCVESVQALIECGAHVNKRNCYGATPLWNGVCHVDVLKLLIKAGADVNIQSSGHNLDHIDGVVYESPRSPIEVAVEEGFFDSAEILLRAGCKVPSKIQRLLGEAYEKFDVHKDVVPILKALISQPSTLKQACRAKIVHSIDYQLQKIENLNVDEDVRKYLRYHIL